MPTYLVESYVPKGGVNAAVAVAAALKSGSGARHRWSFLLPDEDVFLHVLEGPSAEAVREATARAELQWQRMSEVVLLAAEDLETQGGSP